MDTKHIKISDYNYDLPDERIAKFPIAQRDHSKLLVYKHGDTLPFISYGGTSILFLMAEMGLALSVARQIKFKEPERLL